MAKRRRLSFDALRLEVQSAAPVQTNSSRPSAPIAQIAGDSAAQGALAELTAELEEARISGRLVLRLGLDQIDEGHLSRDRMRADPQEMEDLITSIRERGQQMPIEVSALPDGRFGLISGWRRMRALRHLHEKTGEARFAQVLALLRTPENMAEAYRAMVEENEIRAPLSYYERARIAALAAEARIYRDARSAIAGLFAAASRAKRSKIGSFLTLWQALDGRLRFASAIPERLGLALARAIEGDPEFARRLGDRLRKANVQSAEEELSVLERALSSGTAKSMPSPALPILPEAEPTADMESAPQPRTPKLPDREEIRPGIWLESTGDFSMVTLTLSGPKVDLNLRADLVAWLQENR